MGTELDQNGVEVDKNGDGNEFKHKCMYVGSHNIGL